MENFPPSPFNWIDRLPSALGERVLREHRPLSAYNARDAFQPGDRAPGIFRVIAGRVDMGAVHEDGTSVLFNCYFPGECFGELPVIDGGRHIATLSQTRGSRLSLLPLDAVTRLRQEYPEFNEGLMLSAADDVACAIAANLLFLREGRWTTPSVEDCGVAGVCRGWLVDQGLVDIGSITTHAVATADALALCNAVRGILPVSSLGVVEYHPHPAFAALQAPLATALPMFQLHREVA
jgi:CRP-like cAMP-binding protein